MGSKTQRPLSRQFFMLVLVISLFMMVVSSVVAFRRGYRFGVDRIEANLNLIQESYLPSVTASLYTVDEIQLRLLLKGMVRLEGVVFCQIVEELGSRQYKISEGTLPEDDPTPYTYPLIYRRQDGTIQPIGTLTVYADFTAISRQQWQNIFIQLAHNAVMILFAALVVTILFQKLVARHLDRMAEFCSTIDPDHLDTKLALDRQAKPDELEQVVTAVNSLQERLREDNDRRRTAETLLRESEQRYRSLHHNIPLGVFRTTPDGRTVSINPALLQMIQMPEPVDMENMRPGDFYLNIEDRQRLVKQVLRDGQIKGYECRFKTVHGEPFWVTISARAVKDDTGRIVSFDGVIEDIQEKKLAQEAQRENQAFRRRIFESSLIPIVIMDHASMVFIECNPAAAAIYGFDSVEQTIGKNPMDVSTPTQYDDTPSRKKARHVLDLVLDQGMAIIEWRHQRPNGEIWDAEVHLMGFTSNDSRLVQLTLKDITRHKAAEAARERLQAQLNQAQKMEAVGLLAGGIAHDFNNMLSVVMGNIELAIMKLASQADPEVIRRLKSVQEAAGRSSKLVRQLLTFARKQTIKPVVLDINDAISSMLKVLRRLIGEDVELAWVPGHATHKVLMDPTQIDQILANLMVNARDAIGGVGKVTIQTDNVTLSETDLPAATDGAPGDYVLLSVNDTGCGMPREVLDHIFDPFFTTKGIGAGTGLGLATVYGIVTQNNGFIHVHSEIDQGTTFRIYLPVTQTVADDTKDSPDAQPAPRGSGTVLVVEDDHAILLLAEAMLIELGYTVLIAETTDMAMQMARFHEGNIDLLLTDVIMPNMNGRELAEQINIRHPDVKCLFMSGYTADVIAHRGILESGVNFISKPFTLWELAVKVKEALAR